MAAQVMIIGRVQTARQRRRTRVEIVSNALVQQILDLMIERAMTMTMAARAVGVNPVTAWRRLQEPQFLQSYERARVLAADLLITQAEAALDPPDGGACLSPHQVKLRIAQARQKRWLAMRINPGFWLPNRPTAST